MGVVPTSRPSTLAAAPGGVERSVNCNRGRLGSGRGMGARGGGSATASGGASALVATSGSELRLPPHAATKHAIQMS